jgi:hypothetical protein
MKMSNKSKKNIYIVSAAVITLQLAVWALKKIKK